ncbi:MAG: DNA-formamidopyrimidine glycosylase, partial [Leptospiraceae bacterium]|nr:DNA-formamidopyrimidine glycosylase [Leptospiraceae bacterium]
MPELPDLEYIQPRLKAALVGQTIRSVIIKEPILIRNLTGETSESVLLNRTFQNIERVGPFIDFQLDGMRCVVHCMLAGRFELSPIESELQLKSQSKPNGNKYRAAVQFQCDSNVLSYSDSKKMGKIYLAPEDESRLAQIPGFRNQGIGILSDAFDLQTFISLLKKERRQVRVFLMDQTKLSAIGNAYADEILFDAGLHPKTMCTQLNDSDKERLYHSIGAVI